MRTKSTGGFTLIELLIVIAIIGILAAVLIPNLMSARAAAQDRAAQAHSQNVYTAINAVLAEDINAVFGTGDDAIQLDGSALATGDNVCASGGVFTSAGAGLYEVADPGAAVTSCGLVVNGNRFFIQVTSSNHTDDNVRRYENGHPVDEFTPAADS